MYKKESEGSNSMMIVKNSLASVFKRPVILIFVALVVAIILFMYKEVYDIAASFISGSVTMGDTGDTGNSFGTLLSLYISSGLMLFRSLASFDLDIKIFFGLIIGTALLAGILSIGFSGYFNVVVAAMDGRERKRNEFFSGIKNYFLKMWVVNMVILLVSVVLLLLALLAVIPSAILINYGLDGNPSSLFWGWVVGIVTVIVLFFTFMYSIIYFSFWFPGIFMKEAHPFKAGNTIVNRFFGAVFSRFLLLIVVYIFCSSVIHLVQGWIGGATGLPVLAIQLIFNSIFFGFTGVYTFNLFRYLRAVVVRGSEEKQYFE